MYETTNIINYTKNKRDQTQKFKFPNLLLAFHLTLMSK